jgi:hypothetical protein
MIIFHHPTARWRAWNLSAKHKRARRRPSSPDASAKPLASSPSNPTHTTARPRTWHTKSSPQTSVRHTSNPKAASNASVTSSSPASRSPCAPTPVAVETPTPSKPMPTRPQTHLTSPTSTHSCSTHIFPPQFCTYSLITIDARDCQPSLERFATRSLTCAPQTRHAVDSASPHTDATARARRLRPNTMASKRIIKELLVRATSMAIQRRLRARMRDESRRRATPRAGSHAWRWAFHGVRARRDGRVARKGAR